MSKPDQAAPDGYDALFAPFGAAMMFGRDAAMQIFARQCEMIVRYYEALAEATGPEGILAANTKLAADAFEGLNELTALPAMFDRHAKEVRA